MGERLTVLRSREGYVDVDLWLTEQELDSLRNGGTITIQSVFGDTFGPTVTHRVRATGLKLPPRVVVEESEPESLTQAQKDMVLLGRCPYCLEPVKEWKPVAGFFAPEWYQTQREHGIDPSSGHRADCRHKDIRL